MARDTLLDFFADLSAWPGEFLVYDDGYRSWHYTYGAGGRRGARVRAPAWSAPGFAKGDKVVVWGENRPEWIVAFWGCLLRGIVVVPIDYRASGDFLAPRAGHRRRAGRAASARTWSRRRWPDGVAGWPLRGPAATTSRRWRAARSCRRRATRDDLVEIIFTSGATAEPKGVLITHRNVLANIVPIEGEIAKYRKYGTPFFPLRFLNLLPLSHMFGQSMATFVPPMLPGIVVFMRGYNPHEIVRQIRTRRISVLVSRAEDPRRAARARRARVPGDRAAARSEAALDAALVAVPPRAPRVRPEVLGFVVGAAPLDPALEEFWASWASS